MTLKKSFWTLLATLICAQTASAASYQLNEYSVTGLGRSFAGAGIVGDDYSAIAFNPAGMTLQKSGMQLGATLVNLRASANGTGAWANDSTQMNHYVGIPHGFIQYNPSDKLSLGFGAYVPYGLSTRYKADSFVSDSAVKSELQVVDFAPAIAYKLTDSLSVGASFILRYIYGNMTNTTRYLGGGSSEFELDGWTVSGSLGLMYEPIKDTRFGFSWRMKSTQQVKGDHRFKGVPVGGGTFNGEYIGRASPNLPETFTFSAYTKQGKFGLSGTARWTHWSTSFEQFVMTSENPLVMMTGGGIAKKSPYNYDNSWTLTAGLDYYHNDNWTFRVGGGWDESPDHNDNTRTWRIPDNDRIWLSCGFSYIQPKWQIDVGYAHMIGKTSYIDEPNGNGDVDGKLKNLRSNLLGVQAQYKF